MSNHYPRDMSDYGQKLPFTDWSDAAKVGVQYVKNYEKGGETYTLHCHSASEAFLSEIVGANAISRLYSIFL